MPSDDASGRPIDGNETHVDFTAVLRKWPSLNNQRRTEGAGPYLLLEGTMSASGSSWPSRLLCDTYMRFILHHSPRWWVPCYLNRSSPSSSGFGLMVLNHRAALGAKKVLNRNP
jgi:hypothetical protein